MDIVLLDKKKYKNHYLDFSYKSDYYYDLKVESIVKDYKVALIKKRFKKTFINPDRKTDYLYANYWDGAEAYGIEVNGDLIAVVEIWLENWSSRLRVTELWIAPNYRRIGIGRRLINLVKEKAIEKNSRLIMLETQTSNSDAIAFYLAMGFYPIGFDSTTYGNNDTESGEVRIEMGLKNFD